MSSLEWGMRLAAGGTCGAALRGFWKDQDGTTSVEYALVLAVVVVSSAAAWHTLTGSMVRALSTVMDSVDGLDGAGSTEPW
ncbi:MAG: hypothetical protein KBI47_13775 [Armatimonadetes bacterium]|nr:hypothetical protein [Armatimonadota bacterium]MDI9587178.1 hypothetical protein [Acidobacteriota bacterium]